MVQTTQNKGFRGGLFKVGSMNLIVTWQHDIKLAVRTQNQASVAVLKLFCIQEWATLPPQQGERLIYWFYSDAW